jgi:hypothetical protein
VSLEDKLARKRTLPQMPAASGRSILEESHEDDEGNYGGVIERMAQERRVAVQHSPGSPTRWLARPEPESDQDRDRAQAIKRLAMRGANLYEYLKR